MTTKPPKWYWAISALILLWNLLGAFVFAFMVMIVSGNLDIASEQAMASLTEEQKAQTIETKETIINTPLWVNVAFAVAVGFGVLGSLALLMRKKLAIPLLIISLVGVLVQNSYTYLLSDTIEKMGVGLSPVVILVAILLIPFAMLCAKRGWLI